MTTKVWHRMAGMNLAKVGPVGQDLGEHFYNKAKDWVSL